MHTHFATLSENVKNLGSQLKIHFQSFHMSEIFCVILYMKHAILHKKKKNMLISLHLVQYKFAKVRFKNFPAQDVIYWKTFA